MYDEHGTILLMTPCSRGGAAILGLAMRILPIRKQQRKDQLTYLVSFTCSQDNSAQEVLEKISPKALEKYQSILDKV
jgi:hypothetical protein